MQLCPLCAAKCASSKLLGRNFKVQGRKRITCKFCRRSGRAGRKMCGQMTSSPATCAATCGSTWTSLGCPMQELETSNGPERMTPSMVAAPHQYQRRYCSLEFFFSEGTASPFFLRLVVQLQACYYRLSV